MKKYVLITGASGAIGKAIAKRLAGEGYSLYLHYNKDKQSIITLLNELKGFEGEYIPVQADLSDQNGYKKIAEQVFSLNGIIHNAGTALYGLLSDLNEVEAANLIQIHVTSPLLLTKELLPKLINKPESRIVVISSIWGQTGAACEVAYSTVKSAQHGFVKALSKEVALSGVTVNAIAPGAIMTPMLQEFSNDELDEISADIPMGKLGAPENVADAAAFLLSTRSSYITGQVLAVNGGWYV